MTELGMSSRLRTQLLLHILRAEKFSRGPGIIAACDSRCVRKLEEIPSIGMCIISWTKLGLKIEGGNTRSSANIMIPCYQPHDIPSANSSIFPTPPFSIPLRKAAINENHGRTLTIGNAGVDRILKNLNWGALSIPVLLSYYRCRAWCR